MLYKFCPRHGADEFLQSRTCKGIEKKSSISPDDFERLEWGNNWLFCKPPLLDVRWGVVCKPPLDINKFGMIEKRCVRIFKQLLNHMASMHMCVTLFHGRLIRPRRADTRCTFRKRGQVTRSNLLRRRRISSRRDSSIGAWPWVPSA